MSHLHHSVHGLILILGALLLAPNTSAHADVLFDFESTTSLSSPLVSGQKTFFTHTTEQARSGTQSLKFVEPGPENFESWTYDMPVTLTSGTVRVWFYDARGTSAFQSNPLLARYGGSVILENATNPGDFGAVEISELPYGGGRYYGSEGLVDRQLTGNRFDSTSFSVRSIGWHEVRFEITPTTTTIFVNGMASSRVAAPGSASPLRLRIMAGSAGNGNAPVGTPGLPPGYQANWFTTTANLGTAYNSATPWVFYDDLTFNAELPSTAIHTQGFEIVNGTPEYDQAGFFMGPSPNDNTFMKGFVNQWDVTTTTTFVRNGLQSAYFKNSTPAFKSLVFDLSGSQPNTTATVWFYDAKGPISQFPVFDMGGAIMVENIANPADFLALEIWTAHYPTSTDPTPGAPNYYLTRGQPSMPVGNLFSRKFGNRTIGWHRVDIFLTNSSSTIRVDGVTNSDNGATVTGPGLSSGLRLRLMADSPTSGGFANYTSINEVQANYFSTLSPYVYYDDISLPIAPAAVKDWVLFE